MGGKHFAAFPSRSFQALGLPFFRQFFSESSFNTLEGQCTMQVELGNPSSGPTDGELSSRQGCERRVWVSLNASVGSLLPFVLFHFHLCFILVLRQGGLSPPCLSPGCPRTQGPPTLASSVLESQGVCHQTQKSADFK